jgi:hypothetical protein
LTLKIALCGKLNIILILLPIIHLGKSCYDVFKLYGINNHNRKIGETFNFLNPCITFAKNCYLGEFLCTNHGRTYAHGDTTLIGNMDAIITPIFVYHPIDQAQKGLCVT